MAFNQGRTRLKNFANPSGCPVEAVGSPSREVYKGCHTHLSRRAWKERQAPAGHLPTRVSHSTSGAIKLKRTACQEPGSPPSRGHFRGSQMSPRVSVGRGDDRKAEQG